VDPKVLQRSEVALRKIRQGRRRRSAPGTRKRDSGERKSFWAAALGTLSLLVLCGGVGCLVKWNTLRRMGTDGATVHVGVNADTVRAPAAKRVTFVVEFDPVSTTGGRGYCGGGVLSFDGALQGSATGHGGGTRGYGETITVPRDEVPTRDFHPRLYAEAALSSDAIGKPVHATANANLTVPEYAGIGFSNGSRTVGRAFDVVVLPPEEYVYHASLPAAAGLVLGGVALLLGLLLGWVTLACLD